MDFFILVVRDAAMQGKVIYFLRALLVVCIRLSAFFFQLFKVCLIRGIRAEKVIKGRIIFPVVAVKVIVVKPVTLAPTAGVSITVMTNERSNCKI